MKRHEPAVAKPRDTTPDTSPSTETSKSVPPLSPSATDFATAKIVPPLRRIDQRFRFRNCMELLSSNAGINSSRTAFDQTMSPDP
ncbi:hypothetical protein L2E82_04641 [Cichorium intybus]|uniref:Uncharacterized protein n=1 Tax=Cichorium intybus TaxID=13427 RepID=A0ACB9H737_CICIN|nr:hypothetical protein L2E82_04641 [Cichorium intybus]